MSERPSFTCPWCHRTSYHPDDVANRYCGGCNRFAPPERRWAQQVERTVERLRDQESS